MVSYPTDSAPVLVNRSMIGAYHSPMPPTAFAILTAILTRPLGVPPELLAPRLFAPCLTCPMPPLLLVFSSSLSVPSLPSPSSLSLPSSLLPSFLSFSVLLVPWVPPSSHI